MLDFIIYDNKGNANRVINPRTKTTLFQHILYNILGELQIIDRMGHIEKEAKGFKEMLFSALWMHAYSFKGKSYSDIISEINDIEVSDKFIFKRDEQIESKLKLIEEYAFQFVQVIDHGEHITVLDRSQVLTYREKDLDKACLGICFSIPEFKQEASFIPGDCDADNKLQLLNIYADIVSVPEELKHYNPNKDYAGLFTRAYCGPQNIDVNEKFRTILRERFEDFDSYRLHFDSGILGPDNTPTNRLIRFKKHMNSKDKGKLMQTYKEYAYADTVSGGNFTVTLEQLCKDGWNGSGFDSQSQFFVLKVIESALTRITIIDERLFNSSSQEREDELSLKNIRVLNYNTFEDKLSDVLDECRRVLYFGINGRKATQSFWDKLRSIISGAINEAVHSLNSISPADLQKLPQQIDIIFNIIENSIKTAIDSFKQAINDYQLSSDDEKAANRFNKNIVRYVQANQNSQLLEASAAIKELITPKVEQIRDLIVQEVNKYANGDLSCILKGNSFRDNSDGCLFLSIHLGLVEKMLKNSEWLNAEITHRLLEKSKDADEKKQILDTTDRLADKRVLEFMDMLVEKFSCKTNTDEKKEIFISIHSGRGNFSRELENSLKRYPFITLSALENAFNNCKYLLSQVFYNTVYLGKGVANEDTEI